jgi:hypothetical protein
MGWILEPGQSTILHTLSAEGTIREVSGLPAGVSTRPALPADLAAGDELALVASQTPAFGTFTIAFTVVYAGPSGDPGDPGSGELPPGHGHPPPRPRPGPPPLHVQSTLLVRPASSEFTMSAMPPSLTVEQGGASTLDVGIDRTGATYRNPVTVQATADPTLSVDPPSSTLTGRDAVEHALLTVRAAPGARPGGGQRVTASAAGNVSPPGQPVSNRVTSQPVDVTIVLPGDFAVTLTPSTLAVFRDGDKGQVDYLVAFSGSVDNPPRVDVQVEDLPAGVVAQLSLTQPFFTLRAGAGAMTGAFTVRVRASAFFNGALKVHTHPLQLTVVDGYTLALTAAPQTIARNGAAVRATVTVGRGAGFTDPAAVSLALPNGLSASPAAAVVPAGQDSVDFSISASCDVSPGDAVVYAAGGAGFVGSEPSWHLSVVDDFSLSLSQTSIVLVNGGPSQELSAVVDHGQCRPLTLSLSGLPPGVSSVPAALRLAPMATDATFTLTAGDAPPASAQLSVTAASEDRQLSRQAVCGLEVRDPTFGYAFTIESFTIRNTRAWHNDTDVVVASLMLDDRMLPVLIRSVGDVNNGDHPVNLTVNPAVAVARATKLTFSYVILNNGAAGAATAQLQIALNLLADVAGDSINQILVAAGVTGSAVADLLKTLIGLATANCDGIVAIDTFKYTGTELHDLTHSGTASYSPGTLAYPGNLPPGSDAYKRVYESNAGCGSNSDYSVRWSVQRVALAAQPEVTTARRPGAVISRGEPVVVVTDRYGTVWEQRHDRGQGWRGFVNLGMPPGTVAAGAPVASTGLADTGPLEVFVVGAPQTGMDGSTTGQNVFALQEGGDGSPSWVDDRQGPPGDQAAPGASVVAAAGGATIVFVVSDRGQLWERQFSNGWAGWQPLGSPQGTILVPGGLSAVVDAAGQVRVFAIGRNDHVYQLAPSLGPAWRDLGPPPSSAPSGTPSFGATRGFIGGLVLGRDRHVYGLWSSDGDRFSWNDHGAPPGTAGSLVLIGVGPGCPSLIAGETYVGALVVSDSGELSELYRTGDGACHWVSIGPPMGRRNPRVAVSDPSYVGVAMGYRAGFMNGLDGHLYEASASGSGHDWTWTDHGA